jgi:hypothetical protein
MVVIVNSEAFWDVTPCRATDVLEELAAFIVRVIISKKT